MIRSGALGVGLVCLAAMWAGGEEEVYPLRAVPITEVRITGGFWGPRIRANREVTIRHDFDQCEETGRIDNFAAAGGLMEGEYRGARFNDSDVYKVIEGAAYSLATHPDRDLEAYLDDLVAKIAAAQEEDGYLFSCRTVDPEKLPRGAGETRWSYLAHSHELYCAGHLYEAAVAHHHATGKRTLLDVAIKNADLLLKVFGPEKMRDVPGHQEIEIGLVKLYGATGKKEYLDLARFFLEERGRAHDRELYGSYCQDHAPVADQAEAVGHSVRACYMYAGMADVAAHLGEEGYVAALDRIWEDIVSRKLYITGGVGASPAGEAFGEAYSLPNASAYNETCAAIAHALWNHRMFLLHGDGKYIDVLERVIYNGFLAGVSLEGDRFFYPNPLASDGRRKFNHGTLGRAPWFGCACCPVNVVRFVPSIAGYLYAVQDRTIHVNLYAASTARVSVGKGIVEITQETDYPWDGTVKIIVKPEGEGEFAVAPRIPGWVGGKPVPSDLYRYGGEAAGRAVVKLNGEPVTPEMRKGFAVIDRKWAAGDLIELELPMPVRRCLAHEKVEADRGRVAIERGPIVYCLEAVDHGGRVIDHFIPDDAKLEPERRPDLLGGVTVIRGTARRAVEREEVSDGSTPAKIVAVPYHVWAHRDVGEMAVWIPRTRDGVTLPPPPTVASRSEASASHVWVSDTVDALNDQVEPKSSSDHSIPRHTWWDHRGTTEWVQYDLPEPTKVSSVGVYWFDDTGTGQCRVPASWRLLYKEGEAWKPIPNASKYGVEKDRFNEVSFDPIEVRHLRIEATLQPGFSAGLLEWKLGTVTFL